MRTAKNLIRITAKEVIRELIEKHQVGSGDGQRPRVHGESSGARINGSQGAADWQYGRTYCQALQESKTASEAVVDSNWGVVALGTETECFLVLNPD